MVLMTRGGGCDGSLSAWQNRRLAAAASRTAASRKSIVAPVESINTNGPSLGYLKMTGRLALFAIVSGYQPTPPNLQHIRSSDRRCPCARGLPRIREGLPQ